jgi:hypothetical protein
MGQIIFILGVLSTLMVCTPAAWAMSPAKTPTPPAAPAASIPLTSDGHHYRAILFGGSCEEGSTTNDFHDGFIQIATQLNGSGWDVRPSFAGDSAHCAGTAADPCPSGVNVAEWSAASIAQAAGKDPSTVGRASRASLLASLDQAATDLKSGDELLLVIDTHGYGEQVQGQTYWDHGICISSDQPGGKVANFDPATGQMNSPNKEGLMYLSDPDLQRKLKNLASLGVKMGFLDDSCYGGGSLPQLSTYGCTMASTTSQLVNFETGDTSSNADGSQESENGIAFNLPDLLQTDSGTLQSQSLNTGKITMEELWLRLLARSKIAGLPEFSGYTKESEETESLGNWFQALNGDVSYRRGNTPFTATPGSQVESPIPVIDYAQTYFASAPDASTQTTQANLISSYWVSPGFQDIDDESKVETYAALQTQIAQMPQQWSNWVSQFNSLTAQETGILNDLSSLNMSIQWTFTGALAGTEDLLNDVLPTISEQGVFMYKVSQSDGNPWIEVEDNFDTPDSADFVGDTQDAVDTLFYFMNAYKLQHDSYISGLDDSYSDALSAMIVQAEQQAWIAASPATQSRMKNDFHQLQQLRLQETALFTALTADTKTYLTQARMYAYLGYRKQAALLDPKLSQCADFVLKRY